MPKNKGFTVLELMVTISIIAIIAAIGIPSYINWIPKYNLSKSVTNLKADFEMAKLAAKRDNICVSVDFADTSYTIYRDNSTLSGEACNRVHNDSESIIEYQTLGPGVTFDSTSLRDNGAQFRGSGEAIEGDLDLVVNGHDKIKGKRVKIELLGRIRIQPKP